MCVCVQVLQMYLPFCGIAISNAQLFAASRKEYDRSRVRTHDIHDAYYINPPSHCWQDRALHVCACFWCHVGVYYVVQYVRICLLIFFFLHTPFLYRGFVDDQKMCVWLGIYKSKMWRLHMLHIDHRGHKTRRKEGRTERDIGWESDFMYQLFLVF